MYRVSRGCMPIKLCNDPYALVGKREPSDMSEFTDVQRTNQAGASESLNLKPIVYSNWPFTCFKTIRMLGSFAVVATFYSATSTSTQTLGPLHARAAPRGLATTNYARHYAPCIMPQGPNLNVLLGSVCLARGLIRYETNKLIPDSKMPNPWQPRYHHHSCAKVLLPPRVRCPGRGCLRRCRISS